MEQLGQSQEDGGLTPQAEGAASMEALEQARVWPV